MHPKDKSKSLSLALTVIAVIVGQTQASVKTDGLVPDTPYGLHLFGNKSLAGTSQSTQGSTRPTSSRGVDSVKINGIRADGGGQLVIAAEASKGKPGISNGSQLQGKDSPPGQAPWRSDWRCRSMVDFKNIADQRGKFITDPVISFIYGGKPSVELLPQWKHRRARWTPIASSTR